MMVKGVWFNQDGFRFFATAMRAEDLLARARVDIYRSENGASVGYQRNPERPRARAFGRYLQTQSIPLVPSAITLNARDGISGTDDEATIPEGLDLWVIDGQHRIEGFRYAIEEREHNLLRDFRVPVVIASGLTIEQEAEQFRVINETAKKVRTDLARRLLAFAARSSDGRRQIRAQQRLWEATAADVIEMLNSDEASPLRGRIQSPNERRGSWHTIRELSFSTSLRPILTTFPYRDMDGRRIADQLIDYWQAWQEVIPEAFEASDDHVLLRTPGVFSLHQVALYVWEVCRSQGSEPTTSVIASMIGEMGEFATASYWQSENTQGAAVFGSMKGFAILADEMKDALMELGFTV